MRLLMINPAFPDTFWSFRHALRLIRRRAVLPPLGLITVASLLPEDWQVRLVDVNVGSLKDADLQWAEMVMIGGMTVQRDSAKSIVARCKEAGLPVVGGGPLYTCEPEDHEQVDYLVLDEAEITLPQFISDYQAGRAERIYRAPDQQKPDIRDTPIPRWDLLDMRRYAQMGVQFSRGCPFDCDFCNVTALFGRKPRTKAPQQMVAELDALYQAGWRGSIFFVDDNLIGNRKKAGELLEALREWRRDKPRMPLRTEASINLADDEKLTAAMVDAGFDTVFIGIETPDESALAECSKNQNLKRDLISDIQKLHRAGLQVQAGFIVGFDSDTPEVFNKQREFIQRAGICTAMVGILQAPMGTRLYQRIVDEGRLVSQGSGDNVDGTTNIRTRMPIEVLRQGYRQLLNSLYAPEPYYQRVKTFLNHYRPPRMLGRGRLVEALKQLPAFARTTLLLGVLRQGRLQYWRLLLWTTLRHRQHLPLAVTLWAYGYHFRRVAQALPGR